LCGVSCIEHYTIVIERVTVVMFRVDNTGSFVTGCFGIKVRTDTAKLTVMSITS